MNKIMTSILLLIATAWPVTSARAQPPAPVGPPVSIQLNGRHGHVTPTREGCCHTGGGNIDVAQPTPDVVIITMSGVAVSTAHPCKDSLAMLSFDLEQCFEVHFEDPKLKSAKLQLEARVIGLLRSRGKGTADEGPGCATVTSGPAQILTVCAPPHSVCGGESLSVNCKEGPVAAAVVPGTFTLHQTFTVRATSPRSVAPCKACSAEFAPDPALDPLWISYWEPFHGAIKKDFGFQVIVRVVPDVVANGK